MKKPNLFIIFFILVSVLGILSSFNIINKVYQRKNANDIKDITNDEKIDPQVEPVTIVQKYVNYFYDKNYIKAYGLLTEEEKKTIGDVTNITNYTTFPSEIPYKIMLNNREYANGTHSIKASIHYNNEVVIKDFGVIIENQSWKIDYVKDIKNYRTSLNTNSWRTYKIEGLTFKYPSTWQAVNNGVKQVALKPKNSEDNTIKIQIDAQKGMGINDILKYINCDKIRNSKCFESDIMEQEFNEVNSINGNTNSNFLITEKDGTSYIVSITSPLDAKNEVNIEIENILSTFTF